MTPHAIFEDSVERAAHLLSKANLPLIAGLRADIAGIVAAVRLAERLGGAIDHVAAQPSLNEQDALRDIGLMFATPAVVRREADTLLLVGASPFGAELDRYGLLTAERPRSVVSLGSEEATLGPNVALSVASDGLGIASLLAAVRARLNRRPLAGGYDGSEVDRCVGILHAASYGIALWRPEELGPLEVEMLAGLIKDLNRKTRWSGLSISADPTATGATMALGWMAGFPPRTGFARGYAEHDPWRFNAERLVQSGEADAVVWISAFGDAAPEWLDGVPAIVLSSSRPAASGAAIVFPVGCPARDHEGVLYDAERGKLVERSAESASNLPTVAAVLTRIREALPAP